MADHFERVTLIERDAYSDTAEVRKGIPQANHVHGLLLRGRHILEQFFPGLQDDMIAEGVPLIDMANDIAWFTRAGWGVRFPSELKVLAFTQPVLDLHVRRRLAKFSNVQICDQVEVLRLLRDSREGSAGGSPAFHEGSGRPRRCFVAACYSVSSAETLIDTDLILTNSRMPNSASSRP